MSIGTGIKAYCMEHSIPFLAGIEVTNRCNLKCKYCYVDKQITQEMDKTLISKILDELKEMGTRVIVLTGGEVFLRDDIDDIITAIEMKKMLMVIYTNGTIPLAGHAAVLKSNWILKIEMTIYGASEDTYGFFCENGKAYGQLEDNLRLLKCLNKNVLVKIVPTKYNIADIRQIKKMIDKYGFEVNINTLVIGETPNCRSCVLDDEQLFGVVNDIKNEPNVNQKNETQSRQRMLCGAGRYSICIDCCGNVKACFISKDIAGNVQDDNLREIWQYSDYFRDRRLFHGLQVCEECKKKDFCFACSEILITEDSAIKSGKSELCRQAMVRKSSGDMSR